MISLGLLKPSDTTEAIELWNAAVPFDQLSRDLFEEKIYQDDSIVDELRVAAYSGGQLVGLAIGTPRSTAPDAGCLKMFAVHPDHLRKRVGTRMLAAIESRLSGARISRIRIGECPPNYLQPGIDERYASALLFANAAGFKPFAQTHNMSVDLMAAPLDSDPIDRDSNSLAFSVRRAKETDRAKVSSFIRENFPAWDAEVTRTFDNTPVSLHLAEIERPGRENQVVAFSAYDSNNLGTGWFGPMGTTPKARGSGLGTILLKHCLSDLRDQGLSTSVIPWVGPVSFYEHAVGAVVSRTFVRMEKSIA